jgi:cephalosporin-C deacetylase
MNRPIEHPFSFDPYCGYSQEQLLAIAPPDTEPDDFQEFWRSKYRETVSRPVEILDRKPIWSPNPDIEIHEVYYRSHDNAVIGCWLSRPRNPQGAILLCHGYGNPAVPTLNEEFTVISPCLRGMGLSKNSKIPWQPSHHVLYGIESRETYALLGCAADLWTAVSVLAELEPSALDNLHFRGGSFGGGMGALAVPWDSRIRTAYLNVPTFGHNPLRLQFESKGSGEAVRQYRVLHPECDEVLNYFDAATAARYFNIPVLLSPALFDPTVVPPGQFAVANAIPESLRELHILPAGHYEIPANAPVQEKLDERMRDYAFNRAPMPGIYCG